MKNNPMSERRAALDLAIVALDEHRLKLEKSLPKDWVKERVGLINKAIKILTAMKDEGPLL